MAKRDETLVKLLVGGKSKEAGKKLKERKEKRMDRVDKIVTGADKKRGQ